MDKKQNSFRGLIPFSGGIDSTAVLYKTLTNFPNDRFLVFKVNLISSTSANRTIKEIASVENILNKLRKIGISNFEFKKMQFDYSAFIPPPVWDSEVINYAAALCLLDHPEIYEYMEGAILNDFEEQGFNERLNKIAKILYLVSGKNPDNLKIIYNFKNMDKYHVMKSIPPELLKLTWSCRYPEGSSEWTLIRCHKCPPCTIIDKVLKKYPGEFPSL